MKKPNFFFSTYIVGIFCVEFRYPNYHADLWDTNYVTIFYEICENFLGQVYFLIFKKEAPAFSPEAKTLIDTKGDWYVGKSFAYISL